uniref:tripartite motif-containing protein 12A-like n=1 Tax=Euleptes europaea TaxID=460621 RepID=UPI00253FC806|nr:tripartite motif-containing protein 12A-like [Euleptes europaea]
MAPARKKPLKKRIRAEALCYACECAYTDPVVLDCGHSYCRACVEGMLFSRCLICFKEFDRSRLTPNRSLSGLVEITQQLLEAEGEERLPKKAYFCKEEKAIICQTCCASEEHRDKDLTLADVAAREYKIYMEECQENLVKEEKDVKANKAALESETLYYFTRTTAAWKKTRTEFKKMKEFLEVQERQMLAQVMEVYEEIKRDKKKQLSALSKKRSFLQDLNCDMDEADCLPPSEFLEVIGDLLQIYDEREKVQPLGSLSPELQSKILSVADINTFLLGAMKCFRGVTTPDTNGSHPSIDTSEEPQSVSNLD